MSHLWNFPDRPGVSSDRFVLHDELGRSEDLDVVMLLIDNSVVEIDLNPIKGWAKNFHSFDFHIHVISDEPCRCSNNGVKIINVKTSWLVDKDLCHLDLERGDIRIEDEVLLDLEVHGGSEISFEDDLFKIITVLLNSDEQLDWCFKIGLTVNDLEAGSLMISRDGPESDATSVIREPLHLREDQ